MCLVQLLSGQGLARAVSHIPSSPGHRTIISLGVGRGWNTEAGSPGNRDRGSLLRLFPHLPFLNLSYT